MSFGLGLILLAASTLAVWLYVRAEKPIVWAIEDRHASLTLTAELCHSSDALTRRVRTCVVTGNLVFSGFYQDILDSQDGKKTRPGHSDPIQGDLASAE